jgi:hypothetical protein
MKYIKLFENHGKSNPTEEEVYSDADEYFLSRNPDLMGSGGFNTYSHHVSERKKPYFESSYNLEISKMFDGKSDDLYSGLQAFFIKKGYDIQTYSPVLIGGARKAAELIARINMKRLVDNGGKYGRSIWIKCSSGKSICFYFTPEEDPDTRDRWPVYLSIHRFDNKKMISLFWTEPGIDDKFEVVFWNDRAIINGNFKITYDGNQYNEEGTLAGQSAECDSASDFSGYTATVSFPEDDNDPEDVFDIRRK